VASSSSTPQCWHENFQLGFGIHIPFAEMNAVEGQAMAPCAEVDENEKS
jgi:hypothetical protein